MSMTGVIEDEFDVVAGELNAAHARLVDLAVRLLADPSAWSGWECHSLEQFVAWRSGQSAAVANKIVQIARRSDDLPECLAAFRAGLLSLDQLAPIARRVPWWADAEFCRRAQLMTVKQIGRLASRYPFVTDIAKPDGSHDALGNDEDADADADADAETLVPTSVADESITPDADPGDIGEPVPTSTVWFGYDDHGRFRLHADVDAAIGSVIEHALTEARDSLFQHGDTTVDWADALHEIAQRSLDTVTSPTRRSRFHTYVFRHVDGAVTDSTGSGVNDSDAAVMTCDGLRSHIDLVDGTPVSVGRTQRIVPERTRRVVIHRDGGCRVPGCDDHRWLDVHHIVHWAHGGATDTDNLVALCHKHHRMHHQHRLGVAGHADDPDGMVFTNGHGRVIRPSGARPTPPGPRSATETPSAYKPALRERMDDWAQHFNLPDGHRHRWSPSARAS